jgi:hypothetical protein
MIDHLTFKDNQISSTTSTLQKLRLDVEDTKEETNDSKRKYS